MSECIKEQIEMLQEKIKFLENQQKSISEEEKIDKLHALCFAIRSILALEDYDIGGNAIVLALILHFRDLGTPREDFSKILLEAWDFYENQLKGLNE